jgi:DNA processing protein
MSTANDFNTALSPIREIAAYEALWNAPNASVKNIAETMKSHPQSPLSLLVDPNLIDDYLNQIRQLIKPISKKFGVCFIGEADYPEKLFDAKYPVPLLYYMGIWDLIYSPSISVVGTRNPTAEGIKRTKKLVKELVKEGYTIVSGLAKGIDTVAHETAIACGGRAIAVIGTPINENYPKENKELQNTIASEHLLISQVPLIRYKKQDYRLNRFFFPERNKTMSALSLATIIVEAGETSGSLIQAAAALEQKRKLFILDSCFKNEELSWPVKYLEKGAIQVREYQDISKELKQINENSASDYTA